MVAYSALREALKALKDAGTIAYCAVGVEIGESTWWMSTWINNKTDRPQFNVAARRRISEKVLKWLQKKHGQFTKQKLDDDDDVELHMSSRSATGYRGVRPSAHGFRADYSTSYIGTFETAKDAAIAYAKHVAGGDGGDGGGGDDDDDEAPEVVEEAEGVKLHLAPGSKTGYKGVYQQSSGRYSAKWWDAAAQKYRPLGSFDTAVEAAVAYARGVGPAGDAAAEEDDVADDQGDGRPTQPAREYWVGKKEKGRDGGMWVVTANGTRLSW